VKQLSGLDASFLNMETPTTVGHVSSLIVLGPTPEGVDLYAALRQAFDERLHLLPIYRRKLAEVPFGLDHPYWVDDPDLDLEYHVREIGIPAPGDDRRLGEQVARIVGRPLDRTRPLWEVYVFSGLEGGRSAVLSKIHHSTIDGVSGAELLQVLLDTEPEGRDVEPPSEPWVPESAPSSAELLARTMLGYALIPRKAIRLQVRLLRTTAKVTRNPAARGMVRALVPGLNKVGLLDRSDRVAEPTLPNRPAPRTPFNATISPHRRYAFTTLSLSDARKVKSSFGVTVNDVVMALCAGALRRYLAERDGLPLKSLVAMVPISVRQQAPAGEFTNRVTGTVVPIHTDLDDPVERLRAIHASMAAAKELNEAIPATILTDVTEFVPPALAAQASRLSSRIRIADRMQPPFNLTISNVPGPRVPLYLGGAPMEHFYPVSVVAEGQGLNMTVQSYLDNLDFGLVGDRDLVPDLWELCDGLTDAMDELLTAAKEA
jgi:WS/DGAT/MGAT family acyltransferase